MKGLLDGGVLRSDYPVDQNESLSGRWWHRSALLIRCNLALSWVAGCIGRGTASSAAGAGDSHGSPR